MTRAEGLMKASREYAREAEAWRRVRGSDLARKALTLHIETRAMARALSKQTKAVKP